MLGLTASLGGSAKKTWCLQVRSRHLALSAAINSEVFVFFLPYLLFFFVTSQPTPFFLISSWVQFWRTAALPQESPLAHLGTAGLILKAQAHTAVIVRTAVIPKAIAQCYHVSLSRLKQLQENLPCRLSPRSPLKLSGHQPRSASLALRATWLLHTLPWQSSTMASSEASIICHSSLERLATTTRSMLSASLEAKKALQDRHDMKRIKQLFSP